MVKVRIEGLPEEVEKFTKQLEKRKLSEQKFSLCQKICGDNG